MKNKLTEQQIQEQLLAEFDALDKLGRGIGRTIGAGAKTLGSVAGGVAGLGSAIKKGYQAGKQTVGGGGANVNTAQQKPAQQQPAQQSGNLQKEKPSLSQRFKSGAGKFMRGIDNVRNYDYTKGTQTQQDIQGAKATAQAQADAQGAEYQKQLAKNQGKTVGTQPSAKQQTQTQTQTQTPASGGTQATKTTAPTTARPQGGGKQKGVVSQTPGAIKKRQQRAQQKQTQPGQTATPVPGQRQPSAVKQGMNQARQPSKTAQDVGKKSGVDPRNVKIGGQKIDMTDPKFRNLRNAIEKASPGTISTIDKLKPADKQKLKKALA